MTIVYPVRTGLYVNLTNRCPCACTFCIRNNGQGAYGSDSLWLEREPTADEVFRAIESALAEPDESRSRVEEGKSFNLGLRLHTSTSSYSELVFCGYGEPTERLDVLLDVAKRVRAAWPGLPIRVNTNGLSDLIHGEPTAAKFAGLVDTVSVSLNAATAVEYVGLCRPKFGLAAYEAMLKFMRDVKAAVPSVVMTVVATADFTDAKSAACEAVCKQVGVPLRVRKLV